MVKRYDSPTGIMDKCPDGDFVEYIDFCKIVEAGRNHEKTRKMGVKGSGVDNELYAALDKIEKGSLPDDPSSI
uniref:Uncharacterized protein n=1 Tax=viral metagenome TaxID=1070528 RepID=A0A6M3JFD8_9ZZZZ